MFYYKFFGQHVSTFLLIEQVSRQTTDQSGDQSSNKYLSIHREFFFLWVQTGKTKTSSYFPGRIGVLLYSVECFSDVLLMLIIFVYMPSKVIKECLHIILGYNYLLPFHVITLLTKESKNHRAGYTTDNEDTCRSAICKQRSCDQWGGGCTAGNIAVLCSCTIETNHVTTNIKTAFLSIKRIEILSVPSVQ